MIWRLLRKLSENPRCKRCGRTLTKKKSQDRGYGLVCWKKIKAAMAAQMKFDAYYGDADLEDEEEHFDEDDDPYWPYW